jgi:hypothetical protein
LFSASPFFFTIYNRETRYTFSPVVEGTAVPGGSSVGFFTLFCTIAQALSLLSRKETLSGIVGLKKFCTGCWIGFDTWYIPLQSVAKGLEKGIVFLNLT